MYDKMRFYYLNEATDPYRPVEEAVVLAFYSEAIAKEEQIVFHSFMKALKAAYKKEQAKAKKKKVPCTWRWKYLTEHLCTIFLEVRGNKLYILHRSQTKNALELAEALERGGHNLQQLHQKYCDEIGNRYKGIEETQWEYQNRLAREHYSGFSDYSQTGHRHRARWR